MAKYKKVICFLKFKLNNEFKQQLKCATYSSAYVSFANPKVHSYLDHLYKEANQTTTTTTKAESKNLFLITGQCVRLNQLNEMSLQ